MSSLRKDHTIMIFSLALAIIFIPVLASDDSYTVKTSSEKFLGTFLVNQSGFTLYYTQNDSTVNEASTCYGECAAKWMPFYAPNLNLPDSLRPIDFGVITRTDGTKQTTFRGWPLYYYYKDRAPGDEWGNSVDGVWHIVDPDNQPQII